MKADGLDRPGYIRLYGHVVRESALALLSSPSSSFPLLLLFLSLRILRILPRIEAINQ